MDKTPLQMVPPNTALAQTIYEESGRFHQLSLKINEIVVGQQDTIELMLMAVICNGHVLLEGVPGIAKTTVARTFAQAFGLDFKRIQFTPDLLPSDLLGSQVYNQKTLEFEIKKGPLFGEFILADEVNRAPAKVQSGLLQAMEERKITIGNETYLLEKPFLVFATQNPIEQEGTYRLPEAQLDRFLFKIVMRYPVFSDEKKIIYAAQSNGLPYPILTRNDIVQAQEYVQQIYVDEKIVDYIVHLICATRHPDRYRLAELQAYIECGASPRATIALYQAARACAFLKKRHFVIPDDVKQIAAPILRHRIKLSYQADAEDVKVDDIIDKILLSIKAP